MHCGDCRFWFESDSQCRRNAPMPIRNGGERETMWPTVQAEDWCGEYQPGYIDRRNIPSPAQATTQRA